MQTLGSPGSSSTSRSARRGEQQPQEQPQDDGGATCYMCFEDGQEERLIHSPCTCWGIVHESCLRRWLEAEGKGPPYKCSMCKDTLELKLDSRPNRLFIPGLGSSARRGKDFVPPSCANETGPPEVDQRERDREYLLTLARLAHEQADQDRRARQQERERERERERQRQRQRERQRQRQRERQPEPVPYTMPAPPWVPPPQQQASHSGSHTVNMGTYPPPRTDCPAECYNWDAKKKKQAVWGGVLTGAVIVGLVWLF